MRYAQRADGPMQPQCSRQQMNYHRGPMRTGPRRAVAFPDAWHCAALISHLLASYTLHFATNTVREIYPALAIGDHFSFRLDEYAHMHPDLFEKEGYGWHIGNNPGASMLAAIPYALARPVIDPIVNRVQQRRAAAGVTEPPSYNSPWPMARDFYKEAWRRGFDIKFGLAAFVMQALCMAPISALGAVVMFFLLRRIFNPTRWPCGCRCCMPSARRCFSERVI